MVAIEVADVADWAVGVQWGQRWLSLVGPVGYSAEPVRGRPELAAIVAPVSLWTIC